MKIVGNNESCKQALVSGRVFYRTTHPQSKTEWLTIPSSLASGISIQEDSHHGNDESPEQRHIVYRPRK